MFILFEKCSRFNLDVRCRWYFCGSGKNVVSRQFFFFPPFGSL